MSAAARGFVNIFVFKCAFIPSFFHPSTKIYIFGWETSLETLFISSIPHWKSSRYSDYHTFRIEENQSFFLEDYILSQDVPLQHRPFCTCLNLLAKLQFLLSFRHFAFCLFQFTTRLLSPDPQLSLHFRSTPASPFPAVSLAVLHLLLLHLQSSSFSFFLHHSNCCPLTV